MTIIMSIAMVAMISYGYYKVIINGRPTIGHIILFSSILFYFPFVIGFGPDLVAKGVITYSLKARIIVLYNWIITFITVIAHDFWLKRNNYYRKDKEEKSTISTISIYIVTFMTVLAISTLVYQHFIIDVLFTHKRDIDFVLSPQIIGIILSISISVFVMSKLWYPVIGLSLFGIYIVFFFQIRSPVFFMAIATFYCLVQYPIVSLKRNFSKIIYNNICAIAVTVYLFFIGAIGSIQPIILRKLYSDAALSEIIISHRMKKLDESIMKAGIFETERAIHDALNINMTGVIGDIVQSIIFVIARLESFVNCFLLNYVVYTDYTFGIKKWITSLVTALPFYQTITGNPKNYWFYDLSIALIEKLPSHKYNFGSSLYAEMSSVAGDLSYFLIFLVLITLLSIEKLRLSENSSINVAYICIIPILGFFLFRTPIVACINLSIIALIACSLLQLNIIIEKFIFRYSINLLKNNKKLRNVGDK